MSKQYFSKVIDNHNFLIYRNIEEAAEDTQDAAEDAAERRRVRKHKR
jgi:hypothetical protein